MDQISDLIDWTPKKSPQPKIMAGKRCSVEPLSIEKHAQDLFASLCNDEHRNSWTYLPYGPFNNYKELEQWLQEKAVESDTLLYAIVENCTNKALGMCGYSRINAEHGSIEVGYLNYAATLKKTPSATEAMYLMMHYVFAELGYRRYEWKCNALNEASKQAALRLGFTFEGIFRQSNVFKNRNRDTAWFSIIDKHA